MAGIANKPMAIFRRPESPKPLHSRWGDVAISVPTDGSWNQYDNPHRPPPERQSYGPGFVPDCSPSDRVHDALGSNSTRERVARSRDLDEDNKSPSTDRASVISRRNSLSLGGLRPTRLSVRLASRPKHLRGESSLERASHYAEHKKPEFAYKPIHQDYPAEISEKAERPPHRYRYIPTNGRYLEDIPSPRSPRSQSAASFRSSHSRRDSFTKSLESQERERERGREQARLNSRQSYYPEDDLQSVRSSIAGSSDSSGAGSRLGFGLPPRRRTSPFVAADRKRSSSLKPMTLAMVPDPEDLYE